MAQKLTPIEIHPIANGFTPSGMRIIVIGTFPPLEQYKNNKDFFFYSSEKNHFWNRIDNIFPNINLKKTANKNKNEPLFVNKKRKQQFSKEKKIGFIDVFTRIQRKKVSSNDSDIVAVENIISNKKLLNILKTHSVIRICCTYKLAYETIKLNLESIVDKNSIKIVTCSDSSNNEKVLFKFNGNPVELILLYPATRSFHPGSLKDEQYNKYLFL
jgi:G:T/U-mismatch repair DNA glycosylase